MALWQRRVSQAPSAVTVPMSLSFGTWSSRSGNEEGQQTVRGTACPTNGAVAVPAGGELDSADVGGGGVHGQMDLAP